MSASGIQINTLVEGFIQQTFSSVHPKIIIHIFSLPVVLFISLDSFGVSCLVLEISAVESSAFSLIQWK